MSINTKLRDADAILKSVSEGVTLTRSVWPLFTQIAVDLVVHAKANNKDVSLITKSYNMLLESDHSPVQRAFKEAVRHCLNVVFDPDRDNKGKYIARIFKNNEADKKKHPDNVAITEESMRKAWENLIATGKDKGLHAFRQIKKTGTKKPVHGPGTAIDAVLAGIDTSQLTPDVANVIEQVKKEQVILQARLRSVLLDYGLPELLAPMLDEERKQIAAAKKIAETGKKKHTAFKMEQAINADPETPEPSTPEPSTPEPSEKPKPSEQPATFFFGGMEIAA